MRICIDPGHGMGNRQRGVYDPGAVAAGVAEADVVMRWANALRAVLKSMGHTVIRTRVDAADPCPVSRRDDIAVSYQCQRMVSLHCNAASGRASGTEVYYRGSDDRPLALALSGAVSRALGIPDRSAKTETQSQHTSLAVLEFDKCWLIELGFLDHAGDRSRMLDLYRMNRACEEIAHIISA